MQKPGDQKANAPTRRVRVSVQELLALLSRQNYQCALTGRPLTPENASLDHVSPRHAGGQHAIENCQIVIREANAAKGKMLQDEFLRLCRDVVRTHGMGNE